MTAAAAAVKNKSGDTTSSTARTTKMANAFNHSNENINSHNTKTKSNINNMDDTNTDKSTSKSAKSPSTPTSTTIPDADTGEKNNDNANPPPFSIAIAGGGIVGLTLAMSLQHHCSGIAVAVYEQADAFVDDVGAGMGLYANGLRVLHELGLAQQLQPITHPFQCRKWERHDGTVVAEAPEAALLWSPNSKQNEQQQPTDGSATPLNGTTSTIHNEKEQNDNDDSNKDQNQNQTTLLQSAGCRRWRLQKVLFDAARERGIPIHFGKRTVRIAEESSGTTDDDSNNINKNQVVLHFQDATTAAADLVLACDGCQSIVRQQLTEHRHELKYTGTTCLMGISQLPCQGICLPSSDGSDTHGVFFPTGANEQCFQFHFSVPTQQADPNNWGTLSQAVTQQECAALVERLRREGWSEERYLKPFQHVVSALRIGFCLLEPPLDKFVYQNNRVVLLGDAAHPPVPYLGQGGAMGLEDAGVLCLLLRHYCCSDGTSARFDAQQLPAALQLYDQLRVPRTRAMLARAKQMGRAQAIRASASPLNNRRRAKEQMLQRQVFFHETLPILWPGANYDCHAAVARAIAEAGLPAVPEESEPAEGDGGGESVVSRKSTGSRKSEHDCELSEKGKGRGDDEIGPPGTVTNNGKAEKEDQR